MKLIVESGATKTDWCLLGDGTVQHVQTEGMNLSHMRPEALDGIVEEGFSAVNEASLTGESLKLLTWVRDTLPAGTPVSLMRQYVPCNGVHIPGLDRRITDREYARVRDHMLALGLPGFLQEPDSAMTDFIPVFNQPESFV